MGNAVVTGSGSGIGAAIRVRLESEGFEVIGVDLKGAEIIADLSGREGRAAAVREVLERCDGRLDRLVTCAGLGSNVRPASRVASVNYFGGSRGARRVASRTPARTKPGGSRDRLQFSPDGSAG